MLWLEVSRSIYEDGVAMVVYRLCCLDKILRCIDELIMT